MTIQLKTLFKLGTDFLCFVELFCNVISINMSLQQVDNSSSTSSMQRFHFKDTLEKVHPNIYYQKDSLFVKQFCMGFYGKHFQCQSFHAVSKYQSVFSKLLTYWRVLGYNTDLLRMKLDLIFSGNHHLELLPTVLRFLGYISRNLLKIDFII